MQSIHVRSVVVDHGELNGSRYQHLYMDIYLFLQSSNLKVFFIYLNEFKNNSNSKHKMKLSALQPKLLSTETTEADDNFCFGLGLTHKCGGAVAVNDVPKLPS